MTKLTMLSFSCVLLTLLAYIAMIEKFARSVNAVEITAYNLTSNLQEWEHDVAVMFYAPWCKYCKQLLSSWDSIAHLSQDNQNLVVSTFNCEADSNEETCKYLKIDRYPTIGYIGYAKVNQSPKNGFFFSKNEMPRFVRYTADLYPEAIFEWVKFLSFTSNTQRRWNNLVGIFTGSGQSRAIVQVAALKSKVGVLEHKVALFATELEKYKAIELFDSLNNHGDPYPLLSALDTDELSRPLRVCVGDMASEYCKYYPEHPYCKILPECIKQDLSPKICRPDVCPFESEQGRKVVSVCMQPSVVEDYKKALQEEQGAEAGSSTETL